MTKYRTGLISNSTTGMPQVRELRAATQGAQLMHEEARTRWFGANPFRFGAVDQPDIPGVHLFLSVLELDRLREEVAKRPGRVPVVLDVRIL